MTFTVTATKPNGESVSKQFDSRSEAEARAEEVASMGMTDVSIERATASDGGDVEVVDHTNPEPEPAPQEVDLDEKSLSEDPINWVPEHFVDTIEGVPTINRKGYAVLAEHYEIEVTTSPLVMPHENDFEHAAFKAHAETIDGRIYSGHGTAHVERGDDPYLLAELAETRAMKRATAWATGVGMTAVEELKGEL